MTSFIKKFWPTLCVVAVIVYATLSNDPMPDVEMPLIPHLDKLIHAIMFGGLCGAWYFDLYRAGNPLSTRTKLTVAVICVAAGGLDELMQLYLTSDRAGDILDLVADTVGIAVAYFAAPPAVRAVVRRR